MKIITILFIASLIMFPVVGLAEISDTQVPTTITTTTTTVSPQTTTVSPPQTKCGLSTSKVCNECGLGVYKNVYVQCSDGSEITLGVASSCKPAELWNQYANEACANHCSTGGWGGWSDPTSAPIVCVEGDNGGGKPVEIPKATSVCYISDDLMQEYNQLILELQKSESDKIRAEEITNQIIALKQEMAKQQKECTNSRPATLTSPITIENKPVAVSMDRCNEVTQWETKIVYYKKLSGLSDADLKKEGFSREEIDRILQELLLGFEKVKTQCNSQGSATTTAPTITITGSTSIGGTVSPVVIESGSEISAYYKARIEKVTSTKGEEKQIEELKTLRDEIDGLISNLIKSRKELEVSELDTLVKEVKISRGEIKADNMTIKTTEKKILVNMGDRPVSVEPTTNQVLIRDKGLEVNTAEVMIKENILSVGGVDVKMSASEVTEKLNLVPTTIELKEENAKAIYNIKIDERRKLFGFIPVNIQKTVTADAENGNTLSKHLSWYSFLTTK